MSKRHDIAQRVLGKITSGEVAAQSATPSPAMRTYMGQVAQETARSFEARIEDLELERSTDRTRQRDQLRRRIGIEVDRAVHMDRGHRQLAQCRRELAELRATVQLLRSLPQLDEPAFLATRVEARIEARMGGVRYLFFYLLSGTAAGLLQAFILPSSAVPMIGASGAVSGVYDPLLIELDRPTLPGFLHAKGYRSAAIGKWHLGHADLKYWPKQRCFDYAYGATIG